MTSRFSTATAWIMDLISKQDHSTPHVKVVRKLNELNNAINQVKELDGANLHEIDAAIETLQTWKENRDIENRSLTKGELVRKKTILTDTSIYFNLAKFMTMGFSILNVLTMVYLAIKNEEQNYSDDPFLKELCKLPLKFILSVIALEGSIQLFKEKRNWVQLQQLAKNELESVDKALSYKR